MISVGEKGIDSWTKEELWIDWLSGYQCRKAYFEKDSDQQFSLIHSPNLPDRVLLVPMKSKEKDLEKITRLDQEGKMYFSSRSLEQFKKIFPQFLKSQKISFQKAIFQKMKKTPHKFLLFITPLHWMLILATISQINLV